MQLSVLVACCISLKLTVSKYSFRVSKGLDPDQNQPSVGPDLGPNCLQRLSADDKSHKQGKSPGEMIEIYPFKPRHVISNNVAFWEV